jgi:peptide deformylase
MNRAIGNIRTFGDPVLKERAKPVSIFDDRVKRLAALMTEVMAREGGVGLAATQLGVLSRVIVWKDPEEEGQLYVFVNPEITERSESCTSAEEGCLSVPGASVEVSRADEVTVIAQDVEGAAQEMRLSGFLARIVQHEIDHLDGYLIVDRAEPEERRRVLKELRERSLVAGT